jgi:PTH1 family peptidyl-tRNA hydrolase
MKVVCGLGNPGDRYRLTRHNVGFRVIDLLADQWGVSKGTVKDGSARLDVDRGDPVGRVLLVKPARFMNQSGPPLRAALRNVNAAYETDLLVVTDDADLPLGRLRLRRGGSAGGHNGLRDIIETLGTDQFARLRVGIGRNGEMVDHVLSTFSRDEEELAREAIMTAADAVETWLAQGVEEAMNAFNGVDLDEPPAGP